MQSVNNKILITVPASTARGGITNYYHVLREEFPPEIEYFERGSRNWPIRKGFFFEIIRAFKDFKSFQVRLRKRDIILVQTSTSLGFNTTIRDGLFIRYAQSLGLKTIVFFRGWDDVAVRNVEDKYKRLFKYLFFGCNCMIVLTQHTKECLLRWGYKGKIILETTLVDRNLINNIDYKVILSKNKLAQQNKIISLLFLSRIEKSKGIYELINAVKSLYNEEKETKFRLHICGDGRELESIKNKVFRESIPDITISGFLSGESKKNAYLEADVFVFPSWNEGMPNALLEAMGFGLPVITTRVGGIKDFFEDGRNGYFIDINNPNDITDKIRKLIKNQDDMKAMSLYNFEMANRLFRSDIVAERIKKVFKMVINE
ncbi:MAG: glycosyltransferase family 4 protein [Bacteroidales bacterium]